MLELPENVEANSGPRALDKEKRESGKLRKSEKEQESGGAGLGRGSFLRPRKFNDLDELMSVRSHEPPRFLKREMLESMLCPPELRWPILDSKFKLPS